MTTRTTATALKVVDLEPRMDSFLELVVAGLSKSAKVLPTQFLYDKRGSELFDQICELDEYYPTRTELSIMSEYVADMAEAMGPDLQLIEYGSGSGIKTRILLEALHSAVSYVPVDISRDFLVASATALQETFPDIEVLPVCADFTKPFEVPSPSRGRTRRAVYFPGSTIGNFLPPAATRLLQQMFGLIGEDGAILIGADLQKDAAIIEAAYNDAKGVTAEFNLNLLHRINRELGADFDVDAFEHRAVYNAKQGRIEMLLVSGRAQTVRVGEHSFDFAAGEAICTEHSHKYSPADFAALAGAAGLAVHDIWIDPAQLFSVQFLARASWT